MMKNWVHGVWKMDPLGIWWANWNLELEKLMNFLG